MAPSDAVLLAAERLARLQPLVDEQLDAFRLHPRLPRRETADAQGLATELHELAATLADGDSVSAEREALRRLAAREAELLFRLRREADIAYRTGVDPRWQSIDLDADRVNLDRIVGRDTSASPPPPSGRGRSERQPALAPLSSGGFVILGLRDRLLLVGVGILVFVVYVGLIVLRTMR
jgi:hypothetical protein